MNLADKVYDSVQDSVEISVKEDFFLGFQNQVTYDIRMSVFRNLMIPIQVSPARQGNLGDRILRKMMDYEFTG